MNKPTIEEIISANDLREVIGSYIPLNAAGQALCPFHTEPAFTFTIDLHAQTYLCRSCGAAGGVLDFVVAYEHIDARAALRMLAARAGIRLPAGGVSNTEGAAVLLRGPCMIEIRDWQRIAVTSKSGGMYVIEQPASR